MVLTGCLCLPVLAPEDGLSSPSLRMRDAGWKNPTGANFPHCVSSQNSPKKIWHTFCFEFLPGKCWSGPEARLLPLTCRWNLLCFPSRTVFQEALCESLPSFQRTGGISLSFLSLQFPHFAWIVLFPIYLSVKILKYLDRQ